MTKNIFISYSSDDEDKVNILKVIIENTPELEPIIIAAKREVQKPLTKKVIEGIEKSQYIVPIITRKSISTQWINQEIGYSLALKKHVVPIVEQEIMDNLKGFIHNQNDLPYNFGESEHKDVENSPFQKACELLIGDIIGKKVIAVPMQSEIQKNLDKAKALKERSEFEKAKQEKLESREMNNQVWEELTENLFKTIEDRSQELSQRSGIIFNSKFNKQDVGCQIKAEEFLFTIMWKKPKPYQAIDSEILLRYWKTINPMDMPAYSTAPPKEVSRYVYKLDLDEDFNIFWRREDESLTSNGIADKGFGWILESLHKK